VIKKQKKHRMTLKRCLTISHLLEISKSLYNSLSLESNKSNKLSSPSYSELQNGWCDSIGSVEDIQAKLLKRQEAAAKRERAMACALTHQVTLSFILHQDITLDSFKQYYS
jgi:hypothetical protein